jgi:hypothetical protein
MAADSTTTDIGDVVRLVRLFRDEPGEPADPDEVVFTVRHHEDEMDEWEEVDNHHVTDADELAICATLLGETLEDGTGVYTGTFQPDRAGRWHYRLAGTGLGTSAEIGAFNVRRDTVGNA